MKRAKEESLREVAQQEKKELQKAIAASLQKAAAPQPGKKSIKVAEKKPAYAEETARIAAAEETATKVAPVSLEAGRLAADEKEFQRMLFESFSGGQKDLYLRVDKVRGDGDCGLHAVGETKAQENGLTMYYTADVRNDYIKEIKSYYSAGPEKKKIIKDYLEQAFRDDFLDYESNFRQSAGSNQPAEKAKYYEGKWGGDDKLAEYSWRAEVSDPELFEELLKVYIAHLERKRSSYWVNGFEVALYAWLKNGENRHYEIADPMHFGGSAESLKERFEGKRILLHEGVHWNRAEILRQKPADYVRQNSCTLNNFKNKLEHKSSCYIKLKA